MNLVRSLGLGRRADPGQPHARAGPRHAAGELRRRRLRLGRLLRLLPPAQHVPRPVRGRAPSRPRSSRCSTARSAEGGELSAGLKFAERTLAVLLPVLLVFTIVMIAAAWPVTWGLSGGFKDPTPEQFAFAVEPVADHHPLSDADQPRLAARRHPQFARPLLGQRGGADPAQPGDDRRLVVLPRRRRL